MGAIGVKRSSDHVDLTGDSDDEQKRKQARTAGFEPSSSYNPPSSNAYNSSTQSERDGWLVPSTQMMREDADAEIEADEFDDDAYQRYELYGTMSNKIVGVQYYRGIANPGEFCTVRREPSNPYDSNAIRIDNVVGQQIGHIPRRIAEKLAPLVDSQAIVVEGRLAGEKGTFDMPIRLKLFGSGDPVDQAVMQDKFKQLNLPLDHLQQQERERKQAEKARQQAEKARKQAEKDQRKKMQQQAQQVMLQEAARKSAGFNGGGGLPGAVPPSQTQTGPSMDQILSQAQAFDPRSVGSLVNQNVDEEQLQNLPMALQPPKLKTTMLPYQRQGLAWLLDRENPTLPGPKSNDVVQLWKRGPRADFVNVATHHSEQNPTLASGGILADDMGLGKTLQVISLIIADPKRAQDPSPTLIVSPLSVMSNWAGQIETHLKDEHQLKVLTYHGTIRKQQRPADFQEYDVVVTTYETLAIEYMPGSTKDNKSVKAVPRATGLLSTNWRRVVLDEGHGIRNAKSKKAQAAFALASLASSRWVLTGTPLVNTLKDLQSLLRFVGLTGGLQSQEVFSAVVMRPMNSGSPEAKLLLQALINSLCLRRMKEMKFVDLRLPELSSHIYPIKFRDEEREKYEAVLAQARGMLQGVMKPNEEDKAPGEYCHLLEVLLRLRQVCNHWTLCKDRVSGLIDELASKKQVTLSPENIKLLQGLLQVHIDSQEDCAICFEPLKDPVITNCAHFFCRGCIQQAISNDPRCPMCRAELRDDSCLVGAAVEAGEDEKSRADKVAADVNAPSSKVEAMLDILRATTKKEGVKTIIFSQWTSFLNILQRHLTHAGLNYCRLDGSMAVAARDNAIESLNSDPDCTIMLASLSVCSVGLNLSAASQVIMSDSWWSPAIEDQAVDRVYRLGQTRPVNVWRLVMEDSIEARVLDVQSDKRKLVSTAFGEGAAGKRGREKVTRLADIQRLLS